MTRKRDVLSTMTFGQRVAEEETDALANYFVETDQWKQIQDGRIDVVYGSKGTGKSAIYFLLTDRVNALFDRGILLIAAENPRGTLAFTDLVEDPPTSESEFRFLWKMYLLALLGEALRDYGIKSDHSSRLLGYLDDAHLVQPKASLQRLIKIARDYVRSHINLETVEGGLTIDPATGNPGVAGKITFREPSSEEQRNGYASIDHLMKVADQALSEAGYAAWIVLDRLDVAFAEVRELEENALRALFRVYVDMRALDRISFKIFLRSDIWERITEERGFREASHITRHVTITWEDQPLMNLIVRRLLRNTDLVALYSVDPAEVLRSTKNQQDFFYRVFPSQVNPGSRQSDTFKWILSRTQDGTGLNTPRELIHLLEEARKEQLRLLEIGEDEPAGEELISAAALKAALPEVSRARLEQTIYAEYPDLKGRIQALEGGKTEQTAVTLAEIWRVSDSEAASIAQELVDIGFFEPRGKKQTGSYWVPFLYRAALGMVQGTAED